MQRIIIGACCEFVCCLVYSMLGLLAMTAVSDVEVRKQSWQGGHVRTRALREDEYCVRTLAGAFNQPAGIAVAGSGAFALVADYKSHVLRRLDLQPITQGRGGGAPLVTTVAGSPGVSQVYPGASADGIGGAARFNHPASVAIEPASRWCLVTEFYNHAIRHVDLTTSKVTTVAGAGGFYSSGREDGAATVARFSYPAGVAIDPSGAFALVTDYYAHAIRRLSTSTWRVTTLAGSRDQTKGAADGNGASARFNHPFGISIAGGYALVTDYKNHAVRRVDTITGQTTTIAGEKRSGAVDGTGDAARGSSDSAKDDDDLSSGLTARFWYPSAISIHELEG